MSFGEQLERAEASGAKPHPERPGRANDGTAPEPQASRTDGPEAEIRRQLEEMDRHFERLGTLLSAPRSPSEAEGTH